MTEPYNPGRGFTPSSPIGRRFHPSLREYRYHLGQDWRADIGTPVPAAAAGTVWYSGYNSLYSNMVIVRHEANGLIPAASRIVARA
jgi:murein DD-endopeptidase MepM/ murein hydrolase activator NlpD